MEIYRVNTEILNVRDIPSTDGLIIGKVVGNELVEFLEISDDGQWTKVTKGVVYGWVFNAYLDAVPGAIMPMPASSPFNIGPAEWPSWNERAMVVSGSFEGHGTDWGNPVGNFDGAFLTCGLLGFTWKWNNQPPMILEFVGRYGLTALTHLMPLKGQLYYDLAVAGERAGATEISSWSTGERVHEPYHTELKAFWSSPEMKEIQKTTSISMFGNFAKRKTLETQRYFRLATPEFAHFAYWFDQAVLNGQAKTQPFERAESLGPSDVFNWMDSATGWTQKSFDKNRQDWPDIVNTATNVQIKLWILAYLRSAVASEKGDTVTMCRRGTLALGKGWINGTKRNFSEDFGWNGDFTATVLPPLITLAPSSSTKFMTLASQIDLGVPAQRLLDFRSAQNINGSPRYWAIVDFNKPSTAERLFVFDTHSDPPSLAIAAYYVAHGKGSDPDHNSTADIFSNMSGSNCSSLGIYRCQEPYIGSHGESLRLIGLESTNSNAADRAVVLHGADYVSEKFITAYGKLGRSEGCFAVEMNASSKLTKQLSYGSNIIAWRH